MTSSKPSRTAVAAAIGTAITIAISTVAFTPAFAVDVPNVTWSIPEGTTYVYGQVPAAVPTCTATSTDVTVVSLTCVVDPSTYLTTTGTHELAAIVTETLVDQTQVTVPASISYTVQAWTLKGFYSPVKKDPTAWNYAKSGSTVPLKFKVYAGHTKLKRAGVVASFTAQQMDCTSLATIGGPLPVASKHKTLKYSKGESAFHQNWKTPTPTATKVKGKKVPAAPACYLVTMTTHDGSALTAKFRLK